MVYILSIVSFGNDLKSFAVVQSTYGADFSIEIHNDFTVWTSGNNNFGQLGNGTFTSSNELVQVIGVPDVVAVAAKDTHVLALDKNGTVWSWGNNSNGQLGIGNTKNSSIPIKIMELEKIVSISVGARHSVALKEDGTVWTWGSNSNGQLGTAMKKGTLIPVKIDIEGITAVESVSFSTYALNKDGNVFAWGKNYAGELGDGTKEDKEVPVIIKGIDDAIQMISYEEMIVALKRNGTMWFWGQNKNLPTELPEAKNVGQMYIKNRRLVGESDKNFWILDKSLKNINLIIGSPYMLVDKNTKEIDPGRNTQPIISNGRTLLPLRAIVEEIGGKIDWNNDEKSINITVGSSNMKLFIGSIDYVSNDQWKQLDVKPVIVNDRTMMPIRVVIEQFGGIVDWDSDKKMVTVSYTCIKSYCLSLKDKIPLPEEKIILVPTIVYVTVIPTQPAYLTSTPTKILTTIEPTPIPLPTTNTVTPIVTKPINSITPTVIPTSVVTPKPTVTSIPTLEPTPTVTPLPQYTPTSAVTPTTALTITSIPTFTPSATITPTSTPTSKLTPTSTPLPVSTNIPVPTKTPTITDTPIPTNTLSPTMINTPVPSKTPTPTMTSTPTPTFTVTPTATPIPTASPTEIPVSNSHVSIVGGYSYTVFLSKNGDVYAMGSNLFGTLGDGTYQDSSIPVKVLGLSGVTKISTRSEHVLALKANGTVWAWGRNNCGELGNGTSGTHSNRAVQVSGLTNVIEIAAGEDFSLALKKDGTVWSWGANSSGQLGNGNSSTNSSVPVKVLSNAIHISAGDNHALALLISGYVKAWGSNTYGELGNNSDFGCASTPKDVLINGVSNIYAGGNFSVALKTDGSIWTWGSNIFGQLGIGTKVNSKVPVKSMFEQPWEISAGRMHLVVKSLSSQKVYMSGNLGRDVLDSTSPMLIPELYGTTQIYASNGQTFAVKPDGTSVVYENGIMTTLQYPKN